MRKPDPDPDGDALIDCEARAYTLAQIAVLASLPHRSVRNWLVRVRLLNIGSKTGTGLWRFSLLDGLKLTVMQALSVRADLVELDDAALIAEMVATEARKILRQPHTGRRENVNVLVAFSESGEPLCGVYNTHEAHLGGHFPPRGTDRGDHVALRAPYLTIPCTAMLHDMILRTQGVAEAAEREERPISV